jgi:diguanylate cyclase (GGDEF)-like protein/putative nucleotidyltransferase with HDIG domain
MKEILYCIDKSSKRIISLPFRVIKTSTIADAYQEDKFPVIIFDEKFLSKRKSLDATRLSHKICFIHFAEESSKNLKTVRKLKFFDYFTSNEKKEQINFKIKQAQKLIQARDRIKHLETDLSSKNKRIEKLILVDPLTGCYNWRYFLHRAAQEFSRAHRRHYPISFIVLDIDYFRQINEVYSVKVADAVIKKIVEILRKNLRKEDVITRWREDEFFIIAPYLSSKNSCKLAKRLKDKICNHKYKYRNLSISIKVSMGIVSQPEDRLENTRDIVNKLNKCLISAKRRGGNVIIIHSVPQVGKILADKKKVSVDELKAKVEKLNVLATRDLLEVIYGFARAIEAKDFYTGKHVEHTAAIVEEIAKELRLPKAEIEQIKPAAVLHDLGKVGIDDRILSKSGILTPQERKVIETHPSIGAEILRGIHVLRGIIPAILYHHERYDGKGYPLGLKGEEIPLNARIVAIADVYQALVSDRPYRKAYSKKEAIKIIKKESGNHFDPKIVEVFLKVIKKFK